MRMDITILPLLYILGIEVAFTPCFFPVIPIFLTYIMRSNRGNAFTASILFALGIISSFLIYGLAAIYSASFIQAILTLSLEVITVELGLVFIGIGLALLTPFKNVLSKLSIPAPKFKKISLVNAFIFGFLFSIIAAPCASTFLLAFLTSIFLQAINELGLAILQLAVIGAGIGTPFIIIGFMTQKMGTKVLSRISHSFIVRYNEEITGIITAILGIITVIGVKDFELYFELAYNDLLWLINFLAFGAIVYFGIVSMKTGLLLEDKRALFAGIAFILNSGVFLLETLNNFIGNIFVLNPVFVLLSRLLLFVGITSFLARGFLNIALMVDLYSVGPLTISFFDILMGIVWLLTYIRLNDKKRVWGTLLFFGISLLDYVKYADIGLTGYFAAIFIVFQIIAILNFYHVASRESSILASLALLFNEELIEE